MRGAGCVLGVQGDGGCWGMRGEGALFGRVTHVGQCGMLLIAPESHRGHGQHGAPGCFGSCI